MSEYANDLAGFRPWVRALAYQLNPKLAEDLVQEGLLAVWTLLEKVENPPVAWMKQAAGMRMRAALRRGGTWTGNQGVRGLRRSPAGIPVSDAPYLLEGADHPTLPIMAAHSREITQAVRDLPPRQREYVYQRFWLDLPFGQLNQQDHRAWEEAIAPRIRSQLAHLADC